MKNPNMTQAEFLRIDKIKKARRQAENKMSHTYRETKQREKNNEPN